MRRSFLLGRCFTPGRCGNGNGECVFGGTLKTLGDCGLLLLSELERRVCEGGVDGLGDGQRIINQHHHNEGTSSLQNQNESILARQDMRRTHTFAEFAVIARMNTIAHMYVKKSFHIL